MERQYGHLYTNLFGIGAVSLCFLLLLQALWFLPVGVQAQFPVGTQSQPPADTNRDDLESRVVSFFETLRRGNSHSAFSALLQGSPLDAPEASTQSIELRTRVEELPEQFGNIFHWERLETKRVGANIALIRYVLLYDNYPVIWTFMFYRKPPLTTSTTASNPNLWVLVELHFDTDMKSLL